MIFDPYEMDWWPSRTIGLCRCVIQLLKIRTRVVEMGTWKRDIFSRNKISTSNGKSRDLSCGWDDEWYEWCLYICLWWCPVLSSCLFGHFYFHSWLASRTVSIRLLCHLWAQSNGDPIIGCKNVMETKLYKIVCWHHPISQNTPGKRGCILAPLAQVPSFSCQK